jgi:hypothetical protein
MLPLGRATGAHVPGNTSFSHAIFKRFQGAYVAGFGTTDGGHFDNANPMGGFCLLYPGHPNGFLNTKPPASAARSSPGRHRGGSYRA